MPAKKSIAKKSTAKKSNDFIVSEGVSLLMTEGLDDLVRAAK